MRKRSYHYWPEDGLGGLPEPGLWPHVARRLSKSQNITCFRIPRSCPPKARALRRCVAPKQAYSFLRAKILPGTLIATYFGACGSPGTYISCRFHTKSRCRVWPRPFILPGWGGSRYSMRRVPEARGLISPQNRENPGARPFPLQRM